MKKNTIEDIFGDIGNLVPPKIAYNEKKIKTNNTKASEKLKAHELGELLGIYKFDKGLIRGLEMRAWGASFNFYDGFIEYAVNYFNEDIENAEYVSFFSFTPQYSQMNVRQLNYYLHWRYKFRSGECIKVDFSYILLFIYEVINIPESMLSPKKGVRYLGYLWMKYRVQYPQLDKYLSEWIIDYCLVHGIDCPTKYITGFFSDVLKNTTLPEFYLNKFDIQNAKAELIKTCSDYDFNTSKHVSDENRDIFSRYINGALKSGFMLERYKGEPALISVIRDSYVGALCLYENKRRMTLTLYKIERDEIDSVTATEAVRYAENLVKSGLGLRSKHLVTNLTPAIKNRIDDYFMEELTSFKNPSGAIMDVSEKRYEPETQGFSEEEARKIELESREVAELLEGNSINEDIPKEEATSVPEKEPEKSEHSSCDPSAPQMDENLKIALGFIFENDYGKFTSYCQSKGVMPEAMIEEINYFAFLTIEDIVLESDGEEYRVIDDYVEEVKTWLKK